MPSTPTSLKARRATGGAIADLLTLDSVDAVDGNGSALSFLNNSTTKNQHLTLGRLSASRENSGTVRMDLTL